jgi:hypothetical protein
MNAPGIVFAVLLSAAVFYTVWGWPRRYHALSGRSRLFRTVGLALLNLVLALALLWGFIDFGSGRVAAVRQLLYLDSCVLVIVSLLFVAALDALETFVAAKREQKAFVHEMLEAEIERLRGVAASGAAASSPRRPASTPEQDGRGGG